jgi:hypothetical protein
MPILSCSFTNRLTTRGRTLIEAVTAASTSVRKHLGLLCVGASLAIQPLATAGEMPRFRGDRIVLADARQVSTSAVALISAQASTGPVLGKAACNDMVRLKSWKGDYLHRPDSPQGVATWDTGIGNIWSVECVEGGKIQLKSWKGDYLHRPDSTQGVTTWNAGMGNVWIVENNGERVSLRSWKGDYLHRPDSPQGVTTWNTGTGNVWTVEVLVLGKAACNDMVRLKSWKGDYLYRPDSPQGVATTSQIGIGSAWAVECVEGGKIQLKSWKGDYLHRPDSPQGVTTWNTGMGNVWTVERNGDRVSLRSWKGDYLHRPDSPQGVTTWDQGPWTVESASDFDYNALARKFAPVLRFDQAASTFPMSAQTWFANNCHNRRWPECEGLTTRSMETLRNNVPTYYQVTLCGEQIRLTYWWFYGYQPQCDAFGSGTHPADWEHITVTLSTDGSQPAAVTYYQHGGWYTRIAGRGGFSTVGSHPVIYVGKTSHGSYHRSGGSGTCLYWEDWRNPSDASSWDTWNHLVDLQAASPSEPWIVADRTATWDWGLDGSGKGSVGTHPTQKAPACDSAACKGEKDFLGTGVIGEIVDDTNAGCRESQCKTGWKDSQIGCYRCPSGYIDCGGSCAKGTQWYDCINPFNSSRKGYETEFYNFRLPNTDSGLF